jgi:hypothetical protein
MFIFYNRLRVMITQANEPHYRLQSLSGSEEILKFIYCFMVLFLMVYIFKYFLLLVLFFRRIVSNI